MAWTFADMKNWRKRLEAVATWGFGLALLVILGGVAGVAIVALIVVLVSEEVTPNVKAGVLALIGVVGAAIVTHSLTKKREMEARHFPEKLEAYEAMLGTIVDIFLSKPLGRKLDQKKLANDLVKHKMKAAIWADHDLLMWWIRMSERDVGDLSNREAALEFDKLIRAIREELGKDDTELDEGDLISLFLIEGRRAFDSLPEPK